MSTNAFLRLSSISLIVLVLALSACQKESLKTSAEPEEDQPQLTLTDLLTHEEPHQCQSALCNSDAEWRTGFIGAEEVQYQVTEAGTCLLEGDIAIPSEWITEQPTAEDRGASRAGVKLWPQGTVYYTFAPGYPTNLRNAFLTACNVWNKYTGIKFKQRTNQTSYIYVFKDGNKDYSYLGRSGGMQKLSLADSNPGVAIHELGHALGLIHEQQRSDRNSRIWVNPALNNAGNFMRFTNSYNYTTFDWNSIMLYGSSPYGESWTMLALPNYVPFTNTIEYWRKKGKYALPSSADIYAINYMY